MSGFTVQPLAPGDLRSVYPLIREAMPTISLTSWMGFAKRLLGRQAGQTGIITARRQGRAFPCGLFCYRVNTDLQKGKVLIAEHFVAVDLLDPEAVLSALVAELDALGQRLGCNAVRSVVHGGEPGIVGGLSAAGHAPEASLMLKSLPRAGKHGHGHTTRPVPSVLPAH